MSFPVDSADVRDRAELAASSSEPSLDAPGWLVAAREDLHGAGESPDERLERLRHRLERDPLGRPALADARIALFKPASSLALYVAAVQLLADPEWRAEQESRSGLA